MCTEVRTYAHRFARKLYLNRRCNTEHPILVIENELNRMAHSRLLEATLASGANRDAVAEAVRRIAAEHLSTLVEDNDCLSQCLSTLRDMSVDEILPE